MNRSSNIWIIIAVAISALVIVGAFVEITHYYGIFKDNDFAKGVCAAVISVFLTAIITFVLLRSQESSREKRDKNIKIYEGKIRIYSNFIKEMWLSIKDNDKNGITEENFNKIRNKFFGKILLYINDKYYPKIGEAFSQIESLDNKKKSIENLEDNENVTKNNKEAFATFVKILQSDLQSVNFSYKKRSQMIKMFNQILDEPIEPQTKESWFRRNILTTLLTLFSKFKREKNDSVNPFTGQFWHMVIWGRQQFEFFENISKGNEPNTQSDDCVLSLFEYEESDRTNRLKQVNVGDVVFLYCRGGNGYVGVFKVKGYKIFDYKDKKKIFKVLGNEEKEEDIIRTELDKDEDIKKYDVYGTYKDVEDDYSDIRCANLVVEPLVFCNDGVSYVGGVYRRTISRYPRKRAKTLISRFLFELKNHKEKCQYLVEQKDKNVTMSYTAKDFIEFAKLCGVTEPAKKDTKGNWIDE